ncbi:MAG: DUF2232 domain-containing protein [Gammaproteobacteria bacterium]
MQAFAAYLMRGRFQAILVAALCAVLSLLLPPLSYLSGAAVGLVTLRKGPREGLLVMLGTGLVVSVLAFAALGNPSPGIAYLIVIGLPIWILGLVLRSTASLAFALVGATLMGALMVAGVHLFTADTWAWWRGILDVVVKPALEQSGTLTDAQQIDLLLAELSQILTGLLAAATVLSLVISLLIGRWWQGMLYNPGGFRQEFHGLHISRMLALPTLVVLAVALLSKGKIDQIATEFLVVLLVLYMIQGLALAHRMAARFDAHVAWLIALYGLLLVALPKVGLILAAAGFADTWLNFRTPLNAAGDKKQD